MTRDIESEDGVGDFHAPGAKQQLDAAGFSSGGFRWRLQRPFADDHTIVPELNSVAVGQPGDLIYGPRVEGPQGGTENGNDRDDAKDSIASLVKAMRRVVFHRWTVDKALDSSTASASHAKTLLEQTNANSRSLCWPACQTRLPPIPDVLRGYPRFCCG
jgi:hypothetical protein